MEDCWPSSVGLRGRALERRTAGGPPHAGASRDGEHPGGDPWGRSAEWLRYDARTLPPSGRHSEVCVQTDTYGSLRQFGAVAN